MLNDTLLPGTLAGTDPELAELGNDPKYPEELVRGETPVDNTAEEPALEEPELLIPHEENALPDELILGGAPAGKGGLDMIKN